MKLVRTKAKFILSLLLANLLVCTCVCGVMTVDPKIRQSESLFPQWITKEKIRAGYLGVSDNTSYTSLIRNHGLNAVIAKGGFHRKEEFKKTAEGYRRWARACKKEKLHVFIAYNWQPAPKSWSRKGYPYRPLVYSDGSAGIAPCPRDHKFWEGYLIGLGKVVAELSLEPDLQIDGIHLDCELYGSKGHYGRHTCFCDNCFSSFLLNNGYSGSNLPPVAPAGREKWLKENGLLDNYFAFLEKDVEALAEQFRQQLHKINPAFLISMYPTPKNWVLQSISRGFGTADFPMIIFATDTYEGGGHQRIPDDPEEFYRNSGIHGLYAAGFLLSRYDSDRLGVNLYTAAEKCSGYWLFTLGSLWYRERPPAARVPKGTENKYWQSIARANSNINTLIGETGASIDKMNISKGWRLLNPNALELEKRDYKLPRVNFRGRVDFLFYADSHQEVKIGLYFKRLAKYTNNLKYEIVTPEGYSVLTEEDSNHGQIEINFKTPKTGVHLLKINVGRCMFRIESSNTPIAALDTSGFNTFLQTDPLYFYIGNTSEKLVILGDGEGKEIFRIIVESPEGKKLRADTTIVRNNFQLEVKPSELNTGIWSLSVSEADKGKLEDAYFNFVGLRDTCLAYKPEWVFVQK